MDNIYTVALTGGGIMHRDDNTHHLLGALGYGVWEFDIENSTINFSDKWYELFGHEKGSLDGDVQRWSDYIHHEDASASAIEFDKYLRGESPDYKSQFRIRDKDGRLNWVYSHGMVTSYTEDGRPHKVTGVHIQLDERKQLESDLMEGIDMFSSAFKYSGVGMALVSPWGKWLDVNNALCRILGYSREELLQMTFNDFTYQADAGKDTELVRKMLNKEIETYQIEKRYVSRQGKIVNVQLTVSLVWNAKNNPKFFIAQIADITENKKLIDELSIANSELEAAKLSLVNKLEKLEELNHIIAHNLRGPATSINFLADSILKGTSAFDVNESLEMIKEGSKGLLESLDTLMGLTQIRLNKSMPYDNCDIEEIANAVISQLYALIFEKRVNVQLFLQVPRVQYPKAYLESIIYNLLSNAIKYSRQDIASHIVISSAEEDGRVVLTVQDNGIGIDLEKYGDRVFKLNQVFHNGYDSKGVGLFITKAQIESLGGSIIVDSKVNEGSVFKVIL